MTGETLRAFEHSINSEIQLSVIREHTTHADERLRELCTGWDALADDQYGQVSWKTTVNIQRIGKFKKLQPELLCATVVESLSDLDHWGFLNVLCVLLPRIVTVEDEMTVVMPQSKAGLYHVSKKVRAAVFSIICEPANWQPEVNHTARDGHLPDPQY
uniref:Uncharacterized protein n=1 Tax=Hyaloperonospora arabidopsidis (strain Emoy2) TaxID=559515 RepID=M4B583_HYAAE